MKKMLFAAIVSVLVACGANAGGYYQINTDDCSRTAMRRALDNAVADNNSVITVVRCDRHAHDGSAHNISAATVHNTSHNTCDQSVARVVNRRYFVQETVQTYRPVTFYVPSGSYTRTREICGDFGCK